MRHLLPALFLTSALSAAQSPKLDVLVLTGENATDWRWSTTQVRSVLEASGRFDVEIALYPDATLSDRYVASQYDVLLIDYEGQEWSELARRNFVELVASGKGVVAVGGSSRAFPDWKEYHEILGCVWDDAGGADPFGPVPIEGRDRHDLTEGFGDWTDHQDVLLLGMTPLEENHSVLGIAKRQNPATGAVDDVPVVLIGEYRQGRAVTTTLGHVSFGDPRTHASLLDPQYQQFLIRACEWAATGKTSTISRIEPNTLTDADRAEGWQLLFDGSETSGWGEYGGEGLPEDRWSVQNGVLVAQPVEGDQVLGAQVFEEFELELEWRTGEDASSEVLVVPDAGIVGEGHGRDRVGESIRILRPPGEFNHSRVVATNDGIEQWLNGVRIATYPMSPGEWAYRATGERLKNDPELAANIPLLKVVRDHEGASVWFRNVRIRRLDSSAMLPVAGPPTDDAIELFDGRSLEGWTWVPFTPNNAPGAFEVQDGLLVNRATPPGYLRTDATYGDFELEFDWRMNPQTRQGGRAGIMLRMQPSEQIQRQAVIGELFWPEAIDLQLGTNEAGDLHAVRKFPMTADRRRFNGLIVRRMRDMEHRTGEWNHALVRLERGELVVRINGEVVNAATEVGGQPGPIGIRADGVETHLRNVRIRPISR
ncbi:MAG: family 16 glycoside hydrolase [Planctomycetota bacterium]